MVVYLLTMKVMSLLQQRTTGDLKSLVKASVDNRLFKYPEHSDNLPHEPSWENQSGACINWCANNAPSDVAFFFCSLISAIRNHVTPWNSCETPAARVSQGDPMAQLVWRWSCQR